MTFEEHQDLDFREAFQGPGFAPPLTPAEEAVANIPWSGFLRLAGALALENIRRDHAEDFPDDPALLPASGSQAQRPGSGHPGLDSDPQSKIGTVTRQDWYYDNGRIDDLAALGGELEEGYREGGDAMKKGHTSLFHSALPGGSNFAFKRRAERLLDCGQKVFVRARKDGGEGERAKWVVWRCRDRFCLTCQQLRAEKWRRHLGDITREEIRKGRRIRFVTLTQRLYQDEDPKSAVDRMLKSFKSLTKTKAFRRHCTGWARFLEVTWTGRGWHAHIHILAVGTYWKKGEIGELLQLLRDEDEPAICDIRAAQGYAINELVKYPMKPQTLVRPGRDGTWVPVITVEQARQLVFALKGRRMVGLGGTWAKKWPAKPANDPSVYFFGPFKDVVVSACYGYGWAIRALDELGAPLASDPERWARWRRAYPRPGEIPEPEPERPEPLE